MPMTIDGTPFSTSAANRTVSAKRLPGYSARWMPHMQPIGTAKSAAIATRINVPTMAFAIPPPGSPTGFGICVKNAKFIAPIPSFRT